MRSNGKIETHYVCIDMDMTCARLFQNMPITSM